MALPKPTWSEADVHAVRAVMRGTADGEQQRLALTFILTEVCRIFDSPYVADGADRESFVAIGRHQVGVIITSAQTEPVLIEARANDARAKLPAAPPKRGTRKNAQS